MDRHDNCILLYLEGIVLLIDTGDILDKVCEYGV